MKRAGDVLKNLFEQLGVHDDKNYGGFFRAWKEIVGQELFAHCRASDIRGGALIVAVDHPGWMNRVQFKEREILKLVKKKFPQLEIVSIGYALVDEFPETKTVERSDTAIERQRVPTGPNLDEQTASSSRQNNESSTYGLKTHAPVDQETDRDLKSALARLKQAIETKHNRDAIRKPGEK